MNEPLKPDEAKRLILQILETGSVSISHHAETEMAKDSLCAVIPFRSEQRLVIITAWRSQ